LDIGLQAETPNQLIGFRFSILLFPNSFIENNQQQADNLKREKSSKAQADFASLVENLQKELQERAKDKRQMRFPKRYYRFASRNLQVTLLLSSYLSL